MLSLSGTLLGFQLFGEIPSRCPRKLIYFVLA